MGKEREEMACERAQEKIDESESVTEKESFIKSAVIGFAIGDALGVPVEFMNRGKLEKSPVRDMMGYGSHKVPEGTWSDDTSLVVATMESIIEVGKIDFNDIMNKFSDWMLKAKYTATDELFDIGISTRKAIINYISNNKSPVECGATGIYENGNGSLMRILPIAFYCYYKDLQNDEKTALIEDASSITHGHEISKLGCCIFCDYIIHLLKGNNKEEALDLIVQSNYNSLYSEDTIKVYDRILSGKIKQLAKDEIKSSGFVVDTLEASLWCTLTSDNYEDAVIKAVNLGDDTDTVGAIAGGINGIIYGERNIPKRWKEKLRRKTYLEEISNKFPCY